MENTLGAIIPRAPYETTSLPTLGWKEPHSSLSVTTSRACSAPYQHMDFHKIKNTYSLPKNDFHLMGKSSYRVGIGKKAFLTKMLSYPQLYNYSRDQITSFNVISKKASNWPKQSSLVRYIYLHYNLLAFDFPPIPQKDETRILVKRRCSSFTQMNNQKGHAVSKVMALSFFCCKDSYKPGNFQSLNLVVALRARNVVQCGMPQKVLQTKCFEIVEFVQV